MIVTAVVVAASAFVVYSFLARKHQEAIQSIAVMPFVNESGNADAEYLSDGMTETLISSLSQLPNLNVKPRSSVFRYKGKETNPQTIGRELNVQTILNGRVVQRGQDLSLYVELIDVAFEEVVWSQQYKRKQSDLVTLQTYIARDVSSRLKTKLSGADEAKVTKTYTNNPEAYQLYLKGKYSYSKYNANSSQKAIDYYKQAIEIDPNYALAYHGSVLEVMRNNVNAVLDQRKKTGQPMIPHINHPNMGWAVTAEDLARVQGEQFFEVYNGHPVASNYGDDSHPSTDGMWDIILTQRLAELGGVVMYGVATDDTHNYHAQGSDQANAGRGWIMVRARRLTPESLIAAMEVGNFYASTGVRLKDIKFDGARLVIEIEPEAGVTYTTRFIGTRRNYDKRTEPLVDRNGEELFGLRRYSKDLGATLAEVKGAAASYTLRNDELYVRAKIISSKPQANPYKAGDLETAWTQPVVLKVK
ncbi:hypothetical protein BH20ACI3_BH20ACI3_36060 [soil metagenome]